MTVISIKTGTSEELKRIELSDGSLFWFKTGYLPPAFLDKNFCSPETAAGREINADEEAAFRFASACLRAEKTALRLIARAEQCFFGISRKLEQRGHETACIQPVLNRLAGLKLVDDLRFSRLWLESRLHRTATPRRLLAGLCSRGIDRRDAQLAIKNTLDAAAEYTLLERFAARVTRKRRRSGKNTDSAGQRPIKYMLKNEGFSALAIERYLENEE